MKNLINVDDLSKEQLENLFLLADKIKSNKKKFSHKLKGKIIATLFYEPSTRTRLSFESAILQLGANLISTENASANASPTKGESLEDTIKIISGYADAIVMRHSDDDSAARAAAISCVPIINAGSGSASHPTQAILDVYTIREINGQLDGTSIAIMGDLKYGRTANSVVKLLSLYENIRVYGLSPTGLELPETYINQLRANGIKYVKCNTIDDIPQNINVIYQTRVQKERLPDKTMDIKQFTITASTLDKFSKNTLLLHPLPRVDEINPEVDPDPRAVYFRQAHNGIPTRMALLLTLLRSK